MVGRLGTEPLAAIALAGLFTGIMFTFIWPLRTGVQAITSRRIGRIEAGEDLVLEEILMNGAVAGIIPAILALASSFAVGPILVFLKVEPNLIVLAVSYVAMIRWFIPLFAMIQGIMGFLSGTRHTKDIMVLTIITACLNVVFNYVLIFGKLGFPAMGIRGAALGTVLAELVGLIYLVVRLGQLGFLVHLNPREGMHVQWPLIQAVYKQAFPISVQNIGALAIFMVYETFVGRMGTTELAATHILFSFYRINKTIVGGFSQSSAILVGNSLGAKDPDEADKVIVNCQYISAVIGLLVMALILAIPKPIVSLFTSDPETIVIAARAMRFFAPFFFIDILGFSLEMIFTANGWPHFVLVSEFTTNVIFILGATALGLFIFNQGLIWAWTCFGLYQLFHAAILFGGYFSGRWKNLEVEKN